MSRATCCPGRDAIDVYVVASIEAADQMRSPKALPPSRKAERHARRLPASSRIDVAALSSITSFGMVVTDLGVLSSGSVSFVEADWSTL